MNTAPVLSLRGLSKNFGGVAAVADVSFDLAAGMVTALIGPNGAGKSTIINLVTGVFPPAAGTLHLDGETITHLPTYARAARGIARTYQTPHMIQGQSVMTNVMTGAFRFGGQRLRDTLLRPWAIARDNAALALRAAACLERAGVSDVWWPRLATDLPYGIQRKVEIARALAQDPKVILLDEPAAGLNRQETSEIAQLLRSVAQDGRAVLLVEHDMPMVMSTASRVVVVNFGRLLAIGTPTEIAANPDVVSAYLGADEDTADSPGSSASA
jgi:branched-chain amino acid transport system ATP-binding protein